MTRPRVAVVGGGISGLAAAHRLRALAGPGCRIDVLEATERIGGKLKTVDLAGARMETGAEAFLARRPEVPDLLAELGLGGQVVHPSGRTSGLRSGGRLHAIPAGTLMGIPAEPGALTGLLGSAARRADELDSAPMPWRPGSDVTVADVVAPRYGEEVVRRCVDPLLGGVYSGSAATIGLRAALPGLARTLDAGAPSLRAAVEAARPEPREGPVFGALRGGYRTLTAALADAAGARIRTGVRVEALLPAASGWALALRGAGLSGAQPARPERCGGPRHSGTDVGHGHDYYDAVIVALPAPQTARLLSEAAPSAAEHAGRIRLADSAVVALALPADVELPERSGVLVATDETKVGAKALTLSGRKWPHLAPEHTGAALMRLSYGRFGASAVVGESDAQLAARARADVRELLGIDRQPIDIHVQRWRGGLPQYGVDHGAIVDAVEDAVASVPRLAIAGSAWHGVGVPACVASGRAAAEAVAADL